MNVVCLQNLHLILDFSLTAKTPFTNCWRGNSLVLQDRTDHDRWTDRHLYKPKILVLMQKQ